MNEKKEISIRASSLAANVFKLKKKKSENDTDMMPVKICILFRCFSISLEQTEFKSKS